MTVPPLAAGNCLFLDLDGTLLALRDDPATIPADAALLALLESSATYLGGARWPSSVGGRSRIWMPASRRCTSRQPASTDWNAAVPMA